MNEVDEDKYLFPFAKLFFYMYLKYKGGIHIIKIQNSFYYFY